MNDFDKSKNTEIDEILEIERKNFLWVISQLGDSYGMIKDFKDAYVALGDLARVPAEGDKSVSGRAILSHLHFLAMCRLKMTQSVITLFRGYRSDALLHLRKAIECCGFSARIATHPHLVDVWLDSATLDEKKYKKYREKFSKLFPADKPQLVELERAYDYSSKLMHSSLTGIAGHFDYRDSDDLLVKQFDLDNLEDCLIALHMILSTNQLMLRIFTTSLLRFVNDDLSQWNSRLSELEATLTTFQAHFRTWYPRFPSK